MYGIVYILLKTVNRSPIGGRSCSSQFLSLPSFYFVFDFLVSLMSTRPINDPISVIASTSSAAGMAMAYILGGKRFNTACSSTNGCDLK